MKANEAPNKIYVNYKGFGVFDEPASIKMQASQIEYVRKDAFIEKALAYLNEKFYFNNLFYGIVCPDFHAMEEMYEDFRNYMEGE